MLQAKYPNAFLLLSQIARRTRWQDCSITGLKVGQAFIGDWKLAGLRSEKAYQVAKKRLAECGLATFQGKNKGTVATLCSSTVFSITKKKEGEQDAKPTTTEGRASGEPERTPGETKHKEYKEHPDTLSLAPAPSVAVDGRERELIRRVKSLRPNWNGSDTLTPKEKLLFDANRAQLESFTDDDWPLQKQYLAARHPQGSPETPEQLHAYLSEPERTRNNARTWKGNQRPSAKPVDPVLTSRNPEALERMAAERKSAAEDLKQMMESARTGSTESLALTSP